MRSQGEIQIHCQRIKQVPFQAASPNCEYVSLNH